jgi:maleamate amidohydrolase
LSMPSVDWRTVATARDRAIYEAAGYGRRVVAGSRPMLLVIDVTYGFVGHERAPILDVIHRYPNACGEAAWDAVEAIAGLLPAARALRRPVVYSAGFAALGLRGVGLWAEKHPRASNAPDDANDIVAQIAPGVADLVVMKTKPSLFHGTPLIDLLVAEGADTLVVTGGTTSGCIRATVVDAFSYNFPVLVVEEAVFDRGEMSHAINLFDLDQKYANVVSASEARQYLEAAGNSSPPG